MESFWCEIDAKTNSQLKKIYLLKSGALSDARIYGRAPESAKYLSEPNCGCLKVPSVATTFQARFQAPKIASELLVSLVVYGEQLSHIVDSNARMWFYALECGFAWQY